MKKLTIEECKALADNRGGLKLSSESVVSVMLGGKSRLLRPSVVPVISRFMF